jgi:hypothetical protein
LKKNLKENEIFFGGIVRLPIFALPKTSRVRLRARTPPFHGGDTGSNPVRGTGKKLRNSELFDFMAFCATGFEPVREKVQPWQNLKGLLLQEEPFFFDGVVVVGEGGVEAGCSKCMPIIYEFSRSPVYCFLL